MFKPGRWRGEKNKMKALFKLQFHATQVRDIGVDELVLSIVPNESGKTELRSEKATVTDGVCKWKNPIFESVKFSRELRTGKLSKKLYHFVVSTGCARGSSVGEVSIDLADYADAVKPFTVSVPLRSSGSNDNGVLHVSILRVQGNGNQREIEDAVDMNLKMYNDATDIESVCSRTSEVERLTKADPSLKSYSQVNDRGSSGSDMTLSTSETGSCTEQDPTSFASLMSYPSIPRQTTSTPHLDNRKFEWEWSFDQTPKPEPAEIEKLKTELAAMSRKFDLSELELQTLRKQIMKENKKCQELVREVSGLRAERDSIIDTGDSRVILEEVRKELLFEKETNSNLRIRNAELARELEMLEKANDLSRNARCNGAQSAMDDVELEKEELEMQMEQMALEFEILKQENHDLLSKLEQSELKEELNFAGIEIGRRVEELEEEIEDRAREFEADLEEVTRGKVEQEKRAIRAEEALNKMRFENRKTAVRLQEEFGKLTKQMDSIFIEKVHEIEAKSKELEKIRDELKRSDMEKQNLRKQVYRLKDEAVKKNSVHSSDVRGSSKEIATLKEKIRSLEKQMQLKESELEFTRNGFFEKEKEMQKQIEELERKLQVESGKLKERNKSVKDELKNLQERYSEISVKFALAEGERQQLMIALRNSTDHKT